MGDAQRRSRSERWQRERFEAHDPPDTTTGAAAGGAATGGCAGGEGVGEDCEPSGGSDGGAGIDVERVCDAVVRGGRRTSLCAAVVAAAMPAKIPASALIATTSTPVTVLSRRRPPSRTLTRARRSGS